MSWVICFGFAAVLVVFVIAAVILVVFLGQQQRSPPTEADESWTSQERRREQRSGRRVDGFDVRIVEDGFWLTAAGVAIGSTVHYRYRLAGRLEQGSIDFEPGPQGLFVYTGGRPSDVEIVQVDPPPGTITALRPERWEEPTPPPVVPVPRPPFSGFPTAY